MHLRTFRAWLLYASAWLPYAASYYVVFRLQDPSNKYALINSIINIAPAAVLGVFVLRLTALLTWPNLRRVKFFLSHLAGAILFAATWSLAVQVLRNAFDFIVLHSSRPFHLSAYAAQWQAFSGFMIYGNLIGFAYLIQAERRAADEEKRRVQAEALRVQSDLNALRSQLNPHFLFNVLNSVISLVKREPATAEQALIDLSMMLRYALSSHSDALDDEVSLKEEWSFTENYLALEKLRLGHRLQVESSIDPDTLSLDLPALTIQPLVENAVRHGISPRPTGGKISISARSRDGVLMIEIADDGLGALQEDLDTEKGVGLRTVRRRLELYYKNQAKMKVDTSPNCGFRVQLQLPQDDARVLA